MKEKEWVTLETKAFTKIYDLLTKAQAKSFMYSITASTGCGKTLSFESYKRKNEGVYYFKMDKVESAKELYLQILTALGVIDYDRSVPIKSMSDRISALLNEKKQKTLLIFDEAGKFNVDKLAYFQSIRDLTQDNVAIILSGTLKFKKDMQRWVAKDHEGIPELNSRIHAWIDIEPPDYPEKYQIIKANGVLDPKEIKKIATASTDLRKLYQNVMEYRYTEEMNATKKIAEQTQNES